MLRLLNFNHKHLKNNRLILIFLFITFHATVFSQNPGSDDKAPKKGLVENKREIRRKVKKESKERRRKEKAEKKAIKKHHKRIQTKQVRKRMKKSKKKANKNNEKKVPH